MIFGGGCVRIRNTQQITKSHENDLGGPAARKAQERALAARPYGKMLREILANVAAAASQNPDAGGHPLLAVRPEKKILVVVVTADRGLAGGFNANLLKLSQRFVNEHKDSELTFELIGRKGR